MSEQIPKDYATESVNLANVYDPVKYMLKNQQRATIAMVDDIIEKQKNEKEGGLLVRDGHLLVSVEGDEFYDYFLYYDEETGLLKRFVSIGKENGRVEEWKLQHAPNGMLLRYDFELVNGGEGEDDTADDDELALYPGWGESIDPYL